MRSQERATAQKKAMDEQKAEQKRQDAQRSVTLKVVNRLKEVAGDMKHIKAKENHASLARH